MMNVKRLVAAMLSFAYISTAVAMHTFQGRDLQVCATLKACYLINIGSGDELELDGNDFYTLHVRNSAGYTIRCDVIDAPGVSSDFIRFIYNNEVHDEFDKPRYMNGVRDGGATANPVPYLNTCGRKTINIEINTLSQVCFAQEFLINVVFIDGSCPTDVIAPTKVPLQPPTNTPFRSPTNAPVNNPTNVPLKPLTLAPLKPTTRTPIRSPTNAPVKPPTLAPLNPTTSTPVRSLTNAPIKPPTNVPLKQPTMVPLKPRSSAPIRTPTNVPRKTRTNVPRKSPTKAPVNPPTTVPVKPVNSSPTRLPTRAPIKENNDFVCTNTYMCPPYSYRIPGRYCYDTFDDCQCITGYVKDNAKKQCTQIPTKTPTNAPKRPPTSAPSLRPSHTPIVLITLTLPPTTTPTTKKNVCTNSFVCPSYSYRIPGRYCYDTFDDCQCISGYVKDASTKQCNQIPTKAPTNAPKRPPTSAPLSRQTHTPVVAPIILTFPPTTAPTSKKKVCTNSFICPIYSYRIPGRYCYDTFDDCQCISGYIKDDTKKQCQPMPTNAPTKTPQRPPTRIPSIRPLKILTGRPTNTPTTFIDLTVTPTISVSIDSTEYLCTYDFICPSNSYRKPGLNCYETFDDCECSIGFVKDTSSHQCLQKTKGCSHDDDDDDDHNHSWFSYYYSFWGSRYRGKSPCGDDR